MKLPAPLDIHNHYWGIPRPRTTDNKLVQTCCECGAEREIKVDLRPSDDDEVTRFVGDDPIPA